MLTLRPLPAYTDNYIWTLADAAGNALVVDPGQAAPVLQAVAEGLRPVAILLTHHHPDHVAGVPEILAQFDIPCFAPQDPRIEHVTHRVSDGQRIHIDALELELEVIEVPGHTRSHVAYHGGGYLFSGDTLFSMGCGRLFEGSAEQMLTSLERLASLPADTRVCCGHEYTEANGAFAVAAEPDNLVRDERLAEVLRLRSRGLPSVPSSLRSERECNPFLRIDQAQIGETLRARGTGQQASRVDRFAALRAWKDGFAA